MDKLKNTYKPYTRMWIYGFNVDYETIDYNLRQISEAGIGGVELQVLYPVAMEGNIDFFSPEFFKYLNYIVDECDKLGLGVDLTLGSGWPFGGTFITKDMSPDILIPYQQDIIGPTNYSFDFTNILPGKVVRAVLAKVVDGRIDEKFLRDVTDHVHKTYISVWPWGEEVKDIEVGEGVHRLYLFVSNEYRQRVGKAAPNMDGYAMDHCRKDVTDLYLSQLGDTLLDNIDSTKIRSVFCDSIELTGSNWTKYLIDEFKERRGYDLTPYLPALWQDISNISPYIRMDYYKTYGELTVENFFKRINEWAEKRNIKFRLQAHGTWADIIESYSASHIPEGETFGNGDNLEVNINHRRLAVSAGMHRNAPIVSNETYTWLRKPRFLATLEMMKKATDACFIDGINHIINHGYSFYKHETFENLFYASTVISPHNTWWEYYPVLSKYIENTLKYLQESKIKSRVAILTPTSEIWASNPMAELHMSLKIEKHITKELANSIAKAGYWFSFVNDSKVQENPNKVTLETNEIDCLIIPKMEYINLDTLKNIESLANTTKIIFLEAIPKYCDTFVDYKSKNIMIEDIITSLKNNPNVFIATKDSLVDTLKGNLAPDIIINNNEDIGYIIRESNKGEKYIFISNLSDANKVIDIDYSFNKGFKIYDPMKDCCISNYDFKRNTITLELEANMSIIIVECNESITSNGLEKIKYSNEIELDNFVLNIQGKAIQLDCLTTWEQLEDYKHYSGQGSYHCEVIIDKDIENAIISFENIYEICEVIINGKNSGTIWKTPYTLDISEYLKVGNNKIELKVTNLLFNSALAFKAKMPEDKISNHWPYLNLVVEQQRKDKVDTFRERDENIGFQKSGLDGKVVIKTI